MTGGMLTPRDLWKKLNLLDDWVSGGFSRPHPELVIHEQAMSSAAFSAPSVTPAAAAQPGPAAELAAIKAEVAACVKCGLSVGRTRTVPGEGPSDPVVLFVGEGPGADEDRTGRPFVGAAGQYLDTWLPPIGLRREQCFIANCVKCRPPQNREPHPEEITACLPYLERQIATLHPRVICCLGRIAAHTLLGTTASLGELRGRVHQRHGIPVVVTYHPSAVLRDKASLRKPVWEDLKLLKSLIQE
jgi:uracil-DNA glycosylase